MPRGVHYYKYIVDGEWKENLDDPSTPDDNGNINNYVDTTTYQKSVFEEDISMKSAKHQENPDKKSRPSFTKESNYSFDPVAPSLPPHFQTIIFLNKEEERLQQFKQLSSEITPEKSRGISIIKNLDLNLSQPTHAELNHLGVRNKEFSPHPSRYRVYTTTTRYKAKYSTSKLYLKC